MKRCERCGAEFERGECETCAAVARLRLMALATGKVRGRRKRPVNGSPVRGQDGALPVGDRE